MQDVTRGNQVHTGRVFFQRLPPAIVRQPIPCKTDSHMDDANLANVLGAFATRLTDLVRAALTATGHDASEAAALVHLSKYPGEAIEGLRAPLELSHSGCVRLVDRLVEAGLVERREAGDGRAVALHLTRKGKEAAANLLRRREEVLARAVSSLGVQERDVLARVIQRLLPREVPTVSVALRTCRFCDYGACRVCPFGTVDATSV
jgi:DNA-binding MarR family transcriptional regulator